VNLPPQMNFLKCKIGYQDKSEEEEVEMPNISQVKV